MSLARYKNNYQKIMYFIGLGFDRDTKINPSTQLQFKKKRKCTESNRLLIQKVYKIKSILQINTPLMNKKNNLVITFPFLQIYSYLPILIVI